MAMKSLMATNNHYIYSLTDPRDGVVRYIGQGQGRRYEWCRYPKSGCQYGVHPWLRRLKVSGLKPVVTKILIGLTKDVADRWEIDLIDLIGRNCEGNGSLLNLSKGGDGGSNGHSPSAETRKKLSEINKGKTLSKQHRKNLSDAHKGIAPWNKGKTLSKQHRKNLSDARKGTKESKETRLRKSEAHKGKTQSIATRKKMSKTAKKRQSRRSENGQFASNEGGDE